MSIVSKLLAALKNFVLGLGKLLLALFLLFAAYMAYGLYAEKAAAREAAGICASVSPGSEVAGLRERALAGGADEILTGDVDADGATTVSIAFVGLPPFSRHMCHVMTKGGKVLAVELGHLD